MNFWHITDKATQLFQPFVWLVDFAGFDEHTVHLHGKQWVGQLAEERLEETGHDIDVLPAVVVEGEGVDSLVDLLGEVGDRGVVPRHPVDPNYLQATLINNITANLASKHFEV